MITVNINLKNDTLTYTHNNIYSADSIVSKTIQNLGIFKVSDIVSFNNVPAFRRYPNTKL